MKSEIRSQKSEDKSQKAEEVRGQKSGDGMQASTGRPPGDVLTSDF
jgi:hypothetical protein